MQTCGITQAYMENTVMYACMHVAHTCPVVFMKCTVQKFDKGEV